MAAGVSAVDRRVQRIRRLIGGRGRQLRHVPGRAPSRHRTGGNQRLRFRVGHHVRDLTLLIQHVHRHDDDAELEARQEHVDELDAIVEIEAEAIARPQAAPAQDVRQPIAASIEIAEGEFTPGPLEGGVSGAQHERTIEELEKVHGTTRIATSVRNDRDPRAAVTSMT